MRAAGATTSRPSSSPCAPCCPVRRRRMRRAQTAVTHPSQPTAALAVSCRPSCRRNARSVPPRDAAQRLAQNASARSLRADAMRKSRSNKQGAIHWRRCRIMKERRSTASFKRFSGGDDFGVNDTIKGKYRIVREIARSNDIVYEAIDTYAAAPHRAQRAEYRSRHDRAGAARAHRAVQPGGPRRRQTQPPQHRLRLRLLGRERPLLHRDGVPGRPDPARRDAGAGRPAAARGHRHRLPDPGRPCPRPPAKVIHRDIKPDNIHILPGGQVKLTDFGIARLSRRARADQRRAGLRHAQLYVAGADRGRDIDHRSDLFSLGVLLYEMLAGRKPFTGDSVISITYAVMNAEPPAMNGVPHGRGAGDPPRAEQASRTAADCPRSRCGRISATPSRRPPCFCRLPRSGIYLRRTNMAGNGTHERCRSEHAGRVRRQHTPTAQRLRPAERLQQPQQLHRPEHRLRQSAGRTRSAICKRAVYKRRERHEQYGAEWRGIPRRQRPALELEHARFSTTRTNQGAETRRPRCRSERIPRRDAGAERRAVRAKRADGEQRERVRLTALRRAAAPASHRSVTRRKIESDRRRRCRRDRVRTRVSASSAL